jgi:hypothetical protein
MIRTCIVPGGLTRPTGDLDLQLSRRTDHVETWSPPYVLAPILAWLGRPEHSGLALFRKSVDSCLNRQHIIDRSPGASTMPRGMCVTAGASAVSGSLRVRLRRLLLGVELFEECARSANREAVSKVDQMPIARDEQSALILSEREEIVVTWVGRAARRLLPIDTDATGPAEHVDELGAIVRTNALAQLRVGESTLELSEKPRRRGAGGSAGAGSGRTGDNSDPCPGGARS